MDQELQARIAPIASRLWMLAPKALVAQGETRRQEPSRTTTTRRRTGQLIRTTA